MRFTYLIPLLPALVASSAVPPQPASSPSATAPNTFLAVAPSAEPTPAPTSAPTAAPSADHLDLREVVTAPAAAPAALPQYPSITTQWVETRLANGAKTWVPVVYTQTFAPVPDQLPSPAAGEIGLGTYATQLGVATRAAEVVNGGAGLAGGRERRGALARPGAAAAAAAVVLAALL